jgi:hypothetical protein
MHGSPLGSNHAPRIRGDIAADLAVAFACGVGIDFWREAGEEGGREGGGVCLQKRHTGVQCLQPRGQNGNPCASGALEHGASVRQRWGCTSRTVAARRIHRDQPSDEHPCRVAVPQQAGHGGLDQRKQEVKTTRHSRHRFRSNEVPLRLSLMRNLWGRLVLPKRIGKRESGISSRQTFGAWHKKVGFTVIGAHAVPKTSAR